MFVLLSLMEMNDDVVGREDSGHCLSHYYYTPWKLMCSSNNTYYKPRVDHLAVYKLSERID